MIRMWYYKIIMALLHNIYTKKHIKKDSIRDLVKVIFQKFWTLNKI